MSKSFWKNFTLVGFPEDLARHFRFYYCLVNKSDVAPYQSNGVKIALREAAGDI